jgi:pimeloyl-ACP methyl ester carboxylesterase
VNPIEGLLNVPAWNEYRGLSMLQPYERGKIPIVFVHGLLSTPSMWFEVVNEILGDPELRERYQIWWFQYPTGNPIIYSASLLRDSLAEARRTFDPQEQDEAFDRMVIVGQSMGGLLAKLMTQRSNGELWNIVSEQPIDAWQLDDAQKELLRRVFLFEPLPFVRRVVFLVTPHRGSGMADRWFARMFASTVRLPAEIVRLMTPPGLFIGRRPQHKNSITDLSPTSRFLTTLSSLPISREVLYHSIIANHRAADVPGGTDLIAVRELALRARVVGEDRARHAPDRGHGAALRL